MSHMIELMKHHRTHRRFDTSYTLDPAHVEQIILAMQQAPSWMNGQHYSVIRIDDKTLRQQLVELFPNNPQLLTATECWLFVGDMQRMAQVAEKGGKDFVAAGTEPRLIMATDAALAAQNAALAAESLQLGTCFVGGVRMKAAAVIELFQLPRYTFPLFALCMGKALDDEVRVKPRLAPTAVVHRNRYHLDVMADLDEYQKKMIAFAEARETLTWQEKFQRFYAEMRLPENEAVWQQQGF